MTSDGIGGGFAFDGGDLVGLREVQYDLRLARIMAFCGYNEIEDLEHFVAEQRIRFFIAVEDEIARRGEMIGLEKQWNPLGRDG